MQVTIIKEDRVVVVDGEALNFDFTLDDNIWSIQWNGTEGEVEYNDGTPNETITDFSPYQYLVDGHATEKQRLANVVVQDEVDAEAALTYADRRRKEYPPLGDQLDMIFHAGLGGDEFQSAIQAVKDEHPKPQETN